MRITDSGQLATHADCPEPTSPTAPQTCNLLSKEDLHSSVVTQIHMFVSDVSFYHPLVVASVQEELPYPGEG